MKNKKIYIGAFIVLLLALCLVIIYKSPWKKEDKSVGSQDSTVLQEETLNNDKEESQDSDTSKDGTSSYDEFTSEIKDETISQKTENNSSGDSTANSSAIEQEAQDAGEVDENNNPDEEIDDTLDVSDDTNCKYGPIN